MYSEILPCIDQHHQAMHEQIWSRLKEIQGQNQSYSKDRQVKEWRITWQQKMDQRPKLAKKQKKVENDSGASIRKQRYFHI